jgi:hypothetical protein
LTKFFYGGFQVFLTPLERGFKRLFKSFKGALTGFKKALKGFQNPIKRLSKAFGRPFEGLQNTLKKAFIKGLQKAFEGL